jgi:hypothetical protein
MKYDCDTLLYVGLYKVFDCFLAESVWVSFRKINEVLTNLGWESEISLGLRASGFHIHSRTASWLRLAVVQISAVTR